MCINRYIRVGKVITAAILIGWVSLCKAQNGNHEWIKTFGQSSNIDWVSSIAVDKNSNVYVAGSFHGTIDFDPGAGQELKTSVADQNDAYLLKLDPFGNFLWVKTFGSSSSDDIESIAVDDLGNIYFFGRTFGQVDVNPGVGVESRTGLFLVKLDASANYVWSYNIESALIEVGGPKAISVDKKGNVAICGYVGGITKFGASGSNPQTITTVAVTPDAYVVKLDNSGKMLWYRTLGDERNDGFTSVAFDNQGNLNVIGDFAGKIDVDPSAQVKYIESNIPSDRDGLIMQYDSLGNYNWSYVLSPSTVDCKSVAVNSSNDLYVVGNFKDSVRFDILNPNNLSITGTNVDDDMFMLSLSQQGQFKWAKHIKTAGLYDVLYAVAIGKNDNVYATGEFSGSANFSNGFSKTSNGIGSDLVIWKLDKSGNTKWVNSYGSIQRELGSSITVDQNDYVYTTGVFGDSVNFGTSINKEFVTSNGGLDCFVLKLNQYPTSVEEIGVVGYFSIYPNPVKSGNEFIVEMPDNLENRMNIIWEIVSAEGKVLDSGAAANMNSIKIKAPSTAGVYFIVFNDGQELVNQRIVVE